MSEIILPDETKKIDSNKNLKEVKKNNKLICKSHKIICKIRNTGHNNFTDSSYLMPFDLYAAKLINTKNNTKLN